MNEQRRLRFVSRWHNKRKKNGRFQMWTLTERNPARNLLHVSLSSSNNCGTSFIFSALPFARFDKFDFMTSFGLTAVRIHKHSVSLPLSLFFARCLQFAINFMNHCFHYIKCECNTFRRKMSCSYLLVRSAFSCRNFETHFLSVDSRGTKRNG